MSIFPIRIITKLEKLNPSLHFMVRTIKSMDLWIISLLATTLVRLD